MKSLKKIIDILDYLSDAERDGSNRTEFKIEFAQEHSL